MATESMDQGPWWYSALGDPLKSQFNGFRRSGHLWFEARTIYRTIYNDNSIRPRQSLWCQNASDLNRLLLDRYMSVTKGRTLSATYVRVGVRVPCPQRQSTLQPSSDPSLSYNKHCKGIVDP